MPSGRGSRIWTPTVTRLPTTSRSSNGAVSQREGLRIRAAAADREAAMRIAGDAMMGYGIEPDFRGLDSDLGTLGSNPKACAQLVATMDGAVVGVAILTFSGDN